MADLRLHRGNFAMNVALSVAPGAVLAVLGPNGSGKTTALSALAGLLRLDAGSIRLDGVPWDEPARRRWLPAQRRGVGLVVADHLLFPHLSALDNVAFGLRTRGATKPEARRRAARELALLGLAEHGGARPHELSAGQAQRVALARALAPDPAVLLLDEPLSALDPTTRAQTRADLHHRLLRFPGVTVLVTHDPLDALSLADRLLFLADGRVVQQGTPAEVVARPRDPYVAQVVGLNLLSGRATDDQIEVCGMPVVAASHPASGDVWVAVAPSAVALYRTRPVGSPRNSWAMRVRDVQPAGQSVRVHLEGAFPLVADVTAAAVVALRLAVGQEVWASVKASEVSAYPA